jgi:hypothetical protein
MTGSTCAVDLLHVPKCRRQFQCGGAVKVLDRTVSVVELRAAEIQFTWRSGPSQYSWRSLNFWTFPVAVRGMASRNSTDVGAL